MPEESIAITGGNIPRWLTIILDGEFASWRFLHGGKTFSGSRPFTFKQLNPDVEAELIVEASQQRNRIQREQGMRIFSAGFKTPSGKIVPPKVMIFQYHNLVAWFSFFGFKPYGDSILITDETTEEDAILAAVDALIDQINATKKILIK